MFTTLGRLEKIDLRTYWRGEAIDFTPWLAKEENIELLSEAIGMELEVQSQEERVGPFRADILCKDTISDKFVLIENQLERTDHTHLGQLMTYAAGLDAVTIIWIARNFTEEHRAALDWLNRITNETINFFGIEIELYRIGDSMPAPLFNVVAKSNDWSKTIQKAAEVTNVTDTQQLQLEYWQSLKAYLERSRSFIKSQKPSPQHWTSFAIGKSGIHMSATMNTRQNFITVQVVLQGSHAKTQYKRLEDLYKEDSLINLYSDLIWDELPNSRSTSAIYLKYLSVIADRSTWPNQHQWIKERLEKMHQYFSTKIKAL